MNARTKSISSIIIFILVGTIIGLVISSKFNIFTKGYTQEVKISKETVDILSKINEAMAEVCEAVKPSVVNISSTKTIRTRGVPSPFSRDPFFRDFFGDQFGFFDRPREYKQSGLGSGVIVDRDGYILTNNHVISDTDEIKVKLADNKEFKGKVVGADKKTDLAVIKIDAANLPALKLGDSDKLKVGEKVIAIGNPFGLNQTITSGIISALGRANVGIADYEDFIQTDAAINPGNSGGALVNIKGELVGINTAIVSSSGGYQGVGFAIPINMAKVVMDNLINKGKVIRGWLGVMIQPVTADLAKQFGLKNEKGALVADITEGGPADKSGLQGGDVIVEFSGKEIQDPSTLRNMVAGTSPGSEVMIKFLRDGVLKTVKVKIAELPAEMQTVPKEINNQLHGVNVQNITPDLRKRLDIPQRITGVIVTDIAEDSPAAGVLTNGDIITEINKKKINGIKDYNAVASNIKTGQNVLILVYRNGSMIYITF